MINNFKILPGFIPADSFDILKKYNVKETYVGFYDNFSEKNWPVAFHAINRRGEGANFCGIKEFSALAKNAEKNGMNLYLAFNVFYSRRQLDWILKSIIRISKFSSVKGIIVADMNLLLMLKKIKYDKKIIISTLGTVFNKYAIDFYSSLGAKRFVLDRQMTAKEIFDTIKSFPQYQYEIFFLIGDGCLFIDGYCSSMHTQEKDKLKRYNTSYQTTLCMDVLNNIKNKNSLKKILSYKCNICMLYYLKNLSNVSLKIPNRTITNATGADIMETILKIDNKLSQKNVSFKEYSSFCKKLFKENKGCLCNPKVCLCRDLYGKNFNNK